jgi:hypothetical protein
MSITAPGWDGLESTVTPISRDLQLEMDILYQRCFTTDEGRKVLAHLEERFCEPDAWVPGEPEAFGYARSAQRKLVREIQLRMKRAENGRTTG